MRKSKGSKCSEGKGLGRTKWGPRFIHGSNNAAQPRVNDGEVIPYLSGRGRHGVRFDEMTWQNKKVFGGEGAWE